MKSVRALGLYALLTVALTWPMLLRLRLMDPGDSAYFAWAIGWEIHALTTDPGSLPHGNIFHPQRYTLGMDEPILGTTLLALPLAPFTRDAVLLFNLVRLLTFALSGLSAYWFARELGCREPTALLAGAAFAFSPIRTDQIAHLSTLGTQWLPLVMLFIHRFARTGAQKDALLASLFFVLEALACGYHGVIGLAVLPAGALVLLWKRWRLLPSAMLATLVAAAGLLPLYALHRAALDPERYVRGDQETILYSAALDSFLATTSWNRVYGDLTEPFRSVATNNLFPGLVLPALVVGGAVGLWRRRERPSRDAVALAVVALLAALVALGPEVRFQGHGLFPGPLALLREVAPLFKMIRVASRAGIFIALPLAVLAARALESWRPSRGVLAGIAVLAMAETAIVPVPMAEWTQVVDTRRPPPPVYEWLASQPPGTPLVELPMLDLWGIYRRPAFHESVYMVRSTGHWQRLVNGYAGIEPRRYQALREEARGFPSAVFLESLRGLGTRYVVLHRDGYGPNQWPRIERALPAFAGELREVARFGGDTVYEIGPPPVPAPQNAQNGPN
jgi:hypothetical protein